MLNKNGERELVYLTRIDEIKPIPDRDRVECAMVGGWSVMTRKNQFKPNDLGIYFEIDSKVPATEPFEFLAGKHYKIKTQGYAIKDKDGNKVGKFYSQGLLMSPEDFGWEKVEVEEPDGKHYIEYQDKEGNLYKEGDFLTSVLNVVYSVDEDNNRKAKVNPDAKINAALARHPKIAKRWGKTIKKNKKLRKLFLLLFGRKKDVRSWPSHIAAKTDVERIQNMVWVLKDKKPFVATEKVDGSSCSIMAERGKFGKINYYVCSRNVVFQDENQKCFYDKNIYWEAYLNYGLRDKITKILLDYNLPNVALQCEVFGPNVQKRDYSLDHHEIRVFHIVSNGIKMPMDKVVEICEKYDIPHVPIIDDNFILPDTIEELQAYVEGEGSKIDGKPKEGIVFYDKETGQQYFKFVSPSFLMTYH